MLGYVIVNRFALLFDFFKVDVGEKMVFWENFCLQQIPGLMNFGIEISDCDVQLQSCEFDRGWYITWIVWMNNVVCCLNVEKMDCAGIFGFDFVFDFEDTAFWLLVFLEIFRLLFHDEFFCFLYAVVLKTTLNSSLNKLLLDSRVNFGEDSWLICLVIVFFIPDMTPWFWVPGSYLILYIDHSFFRSEIFCCVNNNNSVFFFVVGMNKRHRSQIANSMIAIFIPRLPSSPQRKNKGALSSVNINFSAAISQRSSIVQFSSTLMAL